MNANTATIVAMSCAVLAVSTAKADGNRPTTNYAVTVNRAIIEQLQKPGKSPAKGASCDLVINLTPLGYIQKIEFSLCEDEAKAKMLAALTAAQPLPPPPPDMPNGQMQIRYVNP